MNLLEDNVQGNKQHRHDMMMKTASAICSLSADAATASEWRVGPWLTHGTFALAVSIDPAQLDVSLESSV